jgi:hypothetical protein
MRTWLSVGFVALGAVGLFGHAGCRVAPDAPAPSTTGDGAQPASNDDTSVPATTGGRGGTTSVKPRPEPSEPDPPDAPDPSSGGGSGDSGAAAAPAIDNTPDASNTGGAPAQPDPNGSPACSAQFVTFEEIRAGVVRSNVKVQVAAIATSQKFLLSHTRSGGCLFGAFVGEEPDADGPRGLLIVSYGEDAPEDEACPTGADAIPDDLAPGDVLAAAGYLSSYAPSGCTAVASPQLMVDATCPFERTARTTAPEPFTLSLDEADAIAQGSNSATLRTFAGGLVRLENVTARRPKDGSGSVGPYGVIQLNETRLELHNDLQYGDLTLGGPGDPEKSLSFPYPQHFDGVTGLVYLDYCTWSLAPRDRCADLSPPSANCSE